jgi:adenylate cyclase
MSIAPEASGEKALFAEQLARGARLAAIVRLAVIGVIASWLPARVGVDILFHYLAALGALALSGVVQAVAARDVRLRARLLQALLVLLDMAVLTWAIVVPPPAAGPEWPAPMQLRLGSFPFFFVFLAFAALGYSPFLTLWTAVFGALAWSAGHLWILAQPCAFTVADLGRLHGLGTGEIVRLLLDRGYVSAVVWAQDVLLLLSVGAILAVAVARARDLVARAARSAAQRARLARHFSPNLVEQLVGREPAGFAPRQQPAVALFVDIRGFTGFAARHPPEAVVELLLEFHAVVADAVFRHGGTLDKYLGDGAMVTFGTPMPAEDDARRALACIAGLHRDVRRWSQRRAARGLEPVRIGVGGQAGEVLVGEFGDARRLEFAVLGDAVNVASRLQELTREEGVFAALGDDFVHRCGGLAAGLGALVVERRPAFRLRGRDAPLDVWLLREGEGTRR